MLAYGGNRQAHHFGDLSIPEPLGAQYQALPLRVIQFFDSPPHSLLLLAAQKLLFRAAALVSKLPCLGRFERIRQPVMRRLQFVQRRVASYSK